MTTLTMKYWMGLLCHCIGTLFCCISLATVGWTHGVHSSAFVSIGLWSVCLNGECISMAEFDHMLANVLGRGWLMVCQICASTGVAILCVALALAVVFLISVQCRQRIRALQLLAVLLTAGGVCYCYTLLLYVVETHSNLMRSGNHMIYGSSFYVGVTGVTSSAVAAILYLMEYNEQNSPRSKYVLLK